MMSDDDERPFFPQSGDEGYETSPEYTANNNNKKTSSSFNAFSNLPFIYFIFASILTMSCAIFYIMDSNTAYIVSGIIGCIISIFGIKHFRTLLNLKSEIDDFARKNIMFKKEHNKVKVSVDRLSSANAELRNTQQRLAKSNEKNRANLTQFRSLQDNMEQYSAESIEQLTTCVNKAKKVEAQWHEELFKHERRMLHTVFDRFCSYQSHIGMTKDEFEMFSHQLPQAYQQRFARMGTFEKLSADKNVILYEDFEQALDIFAEMQANDCDIDFQVISTKQKRKHNPSMAFKKKRTTYFTQRQTSYLAEFIKTENNRDSNRYSFHSHSHKISIGSNGQNRYHAQRRSEQKTELALPLVMDDSEDDRDYDDDLLTYQNQIVITRRTTPGHRFNDYGLNTPRRQPPNIQIGFSQIDEDKDDIDPIYNNTPLTPDLFRGGTMFCGNPLVRDISGWDERSKDNKKRIISNIPETPPNIEAMTTFSIDRTNFTDDHMNNFMAGLKQQKK